MEMPIVDNEFLDLFLLDTSEVNSNDLIEEFKFYIFRIMNLSVEDLMQEQVNNDFEIGQLRKGFKKKFGEKTHEIVNLYNIYTDNTEKIGGIKYNLEKINNFCNQKADYETFLKEFEEINSNILTIKSNLNLSGSYSKNEEIIDILSIPNQLITAILNFRVDMFNIIYDSIKEMNENSINEIEIIHNIYLLCSKIKLIFIKTILKSILLENQESIDDFFHLHRVYRFNDLYNLFSDQNFFNEFLIENILRNKFTNLEIDESLSIIKNFKINSLILFKLNLLIELFTIRIEKIKYNIDTYFSKEKIDLCNENLMQKDIYLINYSLEQMTKRNIQLTTLVIHQVNNLFKENENQQNEDLNDTCYEFNNFLMKETFDYIFDSCLVPLIENFYFFNNEFQNKMKIYCHSSRFKKQTNPRIEMNKLDSFDIFNIQAYLNSNDKNISFNFLNRKEFLYNLLKEIQETCKKPAVTESFINFSIRIKKLIVTNLKTFLEEKLFLFLKNTKNFLKSIKDIKKLITPVQEVNNQTLKSPEFNSVGVIESDLIILLEINYNLIIDFLENLDIDEAIDKKDILELLDYHVIQIKISIEEFFNDNMISIIYPNNEIKEDLLSNFKKGIIDKTLKFYENIYNWLNLRIVWEEFEKNSKIEKFKDLLTFEIE